MIILTIKKADMHIVQSQKVRDNRIGISTNNNISHSNTVVNTNNTNNSNDNQVKFV